VPVTEPCSGDLCRFRKFSFSSCSLVNPLDGGCGDSTSSPGSASRSWDIRNDSAILVSEAGSSSIEFRNMRLASTSALNFCRLASESRLPPVTLADEGDSRGTTLGLEDVEPDVGEGASGLAACSFKVRELRSGETAGTEAVREGCTLPCGD